MTNIKNDVLYLKEVFLSGYKSINNVNIEFQKGLNIIIGKNAAGKTNFLKFLSKCLMLDYDELNNFSANLIFENGREISLKASRNIKIEDFLKQTDFSNKIETVLTISGKIIKDNKKEWTSISNKLTENNIIFDTTFLSHGLPNEYYIVDTSFSFKIQKRYVSSDILQILNDTKTPFFVRCLAIDLVSEIFNIETLNNTEIKKLLTSFFKIINPLNEILKKYTPIEEFRFNENYNIFIDEDKESFTLNNLFLEFKIDGNWLPYSNLSDGTKRLFYIISEVFEINEAENKRPSSSRRHFVGYEEISRIILIEEPELGIHPHQFQKLMEFLKIESEKKQIIITTHAPQALDAIHPDELNRIIIAYLANAHEGTKLRHLNESELIKAKEYVKEDYLSDYWLYSDLEK
ncbi:MAG: hypothetical protein EAY66_07220 [Sphingobacteriales bacterium]|nr:MAG: hypothetical protein EAY66_07220 [Sphingobacteriales bacterium]